MAYKVPRKTRKPLFVSVAGILLALAAAAQPPATPHRRPVLVELFTSEGCSDCPPADALLAKLDASQFSPGVQAIVLSEHVTYWNHLGWRDPFSFDQMDQRQSQYSRHFSLDQVYTPQMVVDGAHQFVGSDAAALNRALESAASSPKPELTIEKADLAATVIRFSVRGPSTSKTVLIAALAQDATRSEVMRGENAGRVLHHIAVARVVKEFDSSYADARPLQLSDPSLARTENAKVPLRLIVFLADRQSGHVVAVAEQTVSR